MAERLTFTAEALVLPGPQYSTEKVAAGAATTEANSPGNFGSQLITQSEVPQ